MDEETEQEVPSLKVFAISDLHLEFYKKPMFLWNKLSPKLPDADVVILAGDIGCPEPPPYNVRSKSTGSFLRTTTKHSVDSKDEELVDASGNPPNEDYKELLRLFKTKYDNVVLVPGNHEYYRTKFYDREAILRTLRHICQETEVTFLHRSSTVIGKLEIIGTTLWSFVQEHAVPQLGDFRREMFRNQLDYVETFMQDYTWLRNALKEEKWGVKRMVVTHHLPSLRLIHDRFRRSTTNSGWATNIVDEVDMHSVDLWVCGHTHEYAQCNYGRTQLTANPVGYPGEERVTDVSYEVHNFYWQ